MGVIPFYSCSLFKRRLLVLKSATFFLIDTGGGIGDHVFDCDIFGSGAPDNEEHLTNTLSLIRRSQL